MNPTNVSIVMTIIRYILPFMTGRSVSGIFPSLSNPSFRPFLKMMMSMMYVRRRQTMDIGMEYCENVTKSMPDADRMYAF